MANLANILVQSLDVNGDTTGSHAMNVNGSITPVLFKIVCPTGWRYEIHNANIHIGDAGAIKGDTYGAVAALTNGVEFTAHEIDDTLLVNLFDQHSVKYNGDFPVIAKIRLANFGSGTNEFLGINYNFLESFGSPVTLEAGQYLQFKVQDDLTGLLDHHCTVQGHKYLSG